MIFPLIPFLAVLAIAGGGVTLVWYDRLTKEEKEKADRIASDYAKQMFHKSLEDLSKEQASHVAMLTRKHFEN